MFVKGLKEFFKRRKNWIFFDPCRFFCLCRFCAQVLYKMDHWIFFDPRLTSVSYDSSIIEEFGLKLYAVSCEWKLKRYMKKFLLNNDNTKYRILTDIYDYLMS